MTRVERVQIDVDPNDLKAYKDLDKGQIYYNAESKEFGIKLSPARFYSFRWECVFGFCENKSNDSDRRIYLPIKNVEFELYRCIYGGLSCRRANCQNCAVKERELRRMTQNGK